MARFRLGDRPVTLGYSANVRPAQSLEQVCTHLRTVTAGVHRAVAPGRPFGACLYFGAGALRDLSDAPERVAELQAALADGPAFVFAVNAFPLGDFHARVVKEGAYRPDWTQPERLSPTRSTSTASSPRAGPATKSP